MWHCCRPEFWQRLCLTLRDQDTSDANFCFTILSSLRMGSYWNPEIPFTCSWDDPSPQSSSTSPSLKKKIRSLGIYFFRNSASRKPNSEIILQTFFFFKNFSHRSLDRKIQRRSCGWKRLWAYDFWDWLVRSLTCLVSPARSCWCGDTDFLRPEKSNFLGIYNMTKLFHSLPLKNYIFCDDFAATRSQKWSCHHALSCNNAVSCMYKYLW